MPDSEAAADNLADWAAASRSFSIHAVGHPFRPGFASNRLPSVKKRETPSVISFSTGRLVCNMVSVSN